MVLTCLPIAFVSLGVIAWAMHESNDATWNGGESEEENLGYKHEERIVFLCFVSLYVLSITIGFSSTVWGITSEVLPMYLLGTASAICASAGWLVNFAITSVFLNVLDD